MVSACAHPKIHLLLVWHMTSQVGGVTSTVSNAMRAGGAMPEGARATEGGAGYSPLHQVVVVPGQATWVGKNKHAGL